MDEEILRRIRLSPAERQVLRERIQTAQVDLGELLGTLDEDGTPGVERFIMGWVGFSHTASFMTDFLQDKTHRAIHTLMQERGQ